MYPSQACLSYNKLKEQHAEEEQICTVSVFLKECEIKRIMLNLAAIVLNPALDSKPFPEESIMHEMICLPDNKGEADS